MKTILLTGGCGSGKTWVMLQLIKYLNADTKASAGLHSWVQSNEHAILGNYDGSIFQGGDRLSMGVMADNSKALAALADKIVIAEGDRYTNSTFIRDFNPYIILIRDDGSEGRKRRGSQQSERHIQSIRTRVLNIKQHESVKDSEEALSRILWVLNDGVPVPEAEDKNIFEL